VAVLVFILVFITSGLNVAVLVFFTGPATGPAGRVIRLKKQIQSRHSFAVPILVTVWLMSFRIQELAKNTVVSGQMSDMSTRFGQFARSFG
jgi:hypothetical protein